MTRRWPRKWLETADWYKRVHKPASSAYYYMYLIKQYPESPEAQEAQKKLAQLPPEARKAPEPPGNPADNAAGR